MRMWRERFGKIDPVEVDRITDKSVWFTTTNAFGAEKQRRVARHGSYENYYDTWEEAHADLLAKAEGQLNAARRRLQEAQGHYGNVKGMKKPVENDGGGE